MLGNFNSYKTNAKTKEAENEYECKIITLKKENCSLWNDLYYVSNKKDKLKQKNKKLKGKMADERKRRKDAELKCEELKNSFESEKRIMEVESECNNVVLLMMAAMQYEDLREELAKTSTEIIGKLTKRMFKGGSK